MDVILKYQAEAIRQVEGQPNSPKSSTTLPGEPLDMRRHVEERAAMFNAIVPDAPRTDCEVCHGKGLIMHAEEREGRFYNTAGEHGCVETQSARQREERAGLNGALAHFTFDTFTTNESWQRDAVMKAKAYALRPQGWLVVTGASGTGKTHLCTAAYRELVARGKNARREEWRRVAPKLKAFLTSDYVRYERELNGLCAVEVLFVDDFFKGSVTDADVNLAYTLLNDRYNGKRPTILSTELSIEEILRLDEAIGGRIYERSKGFLIKTPAGNHRLKRA